MQRREFLAGAGALAAAGAMPALAQSFPTRPVVLYCAFSAGGPTDQVFRVFAEAATRTLGGSVVVENKPGAGGNIAADQVARSAKDGNTLLVSFTSFTVNASLYKKLPFDPQKDFTPISILAQVPSVLVARKDFPANNVEELIKLGKSKPKELSFALGGIGSSLHMATASFQMVTGIEGLNVPYKGTSPALQDLVGGQVDLMFASVENVLPLLDSGRIKFLAVTSDKPLKQFPGLRPVSDTVPGFTSQAWFGMFGPAGLSPERLAELNKAVVEGAKRPSFISLMTHGGGQVVTNTPAEFAEFIKKDIAHYAEVVKFTGASAD